jgi:hypothetical protein
MWTPCPLPLGSNKRRASGLFVSPESLPFPRRGPGGRCGRQWVKIVKAAKASGSSTMAVPIASSQISRFTSVSMDRPTLEDMDRSGNSKRSERATRPRIVLAGHGPD